MAAPKTWKEEILKVISKAKHPIALREIYKAMRNSDLVTPWHLEPWKGDKQLRYENQIRRELTNLRREERIHWISRGL